MSQWEWSVNTGNPAQDQAMIAHHRQQAAAQGMQLDVQPSPAGGFTLRAVQAGAPGQQGFAPPPQQQGFAAPQQQAYGAPAQQAYGAPQQPYGAPQQQAYGAQPQGAYGAPQGYGAPAQAAAQPYVPPPVQTPMGAAVAGGVVAMGPGATADAGAMPLGEARVRYLRKVYGLLTGAAFVAILVGMLVTELSPTVKMKDPYGHVVAVPVLVSILLGAPVLQYALFGVLFVATIVASWMSKVKYLNVVALMGVAALMGLDMAPMVFIAQWKAAMGTTISTTPVTSTFIMVGLIFTSITGYIFVTRKDFSYLGAALTMGFFVIFGAGILAIFLKSDIFSLAVASAGAVFSGVFLLYVTSYIFRNSEMDDPVGDALALLVQLRNLFMFLLRIFMSRD
jgi:FtsH-binding integral membrane protein